MAGMKPFYQDEKVKLYQADVLEWALDYKKKIDTGDTLPFHAICADPPYSLGETPDIVKLLTAWLAGDNFDGFSSGFMQKVWDVMPGPQVWRALLNIVYPGGYMFLFSGTRTADLLGIACRLGGWEPFDRVTNFMWAYGCVDDQTEILTQDGWTLYHKTIANKQLLCYNVDNDTFSWEKPERIFVYDYEDTAYRIKSDFTDQLVSKGHRCLVERKGNLVFQTAGGFNAGQKARVPILENLPELLKALSDKGQVCCKEEDLFTPLCQSSNRRRPQAQTSQANVRTGYDLGCLQDLRNWILQTQRLGEKVKRAFLRLKLFWQGTRQRASQAQSQRACSLDRGKLALLSRKDEWAKQSCLEGRCYSPEQQGKLRTVQDKIRQVPRGVFGNGSPGWVDSTAPVACCSTGGAHTNIGGNRTPHRQQSRKQQSRQSDAIQDTSGSQTIRGSRFTTTHLATIRPEHYKGLMWCPQVPTGAFVARRNGKVFITGNSGFPKSHNLSVALDKEAGAAREVVGQNQWAGRQPNKRNNASSLYGDFKADNHSATEVTAPATPLGVAFDGYGSALKPAGEPILLFRKPREGHTFAQCARRDGSGGLNIGATRVSGVKEGDPLRFTKSKRTVHRSFGKGGDMGDGGMYDPERPIGVEVKQDGRWPPNTHFTHVPPTGPCSTCHGSGCDECHGRGMVGGCRRVGSRKVRTSTATNKGGAQATWGTYGAFEPGDNERGYADPDGKEQVADWECVEGCAVRALDEMAGPRPGHDHVRHSRGNEAPGNQHATYGKFGKSTTGGYKDGSSVSRFYPNHDWSYEIAERLSGETPFKYQAKVSPGERNAGCKENGHPTLKPISLIKWLASLCCPPPQFSPRLCVPFSGSGSEVIAAILSGNWTEIHGIERELEYCEIAAARIAWWTKWAKFTGLTDPAAIRKLAEGAESKTASHNDKHQTDLFSAMGLE